MFPAGEDFDAKFTFETGGSAIVDNDLPFNILLLGNWSGEISNSIGKREDVFHSVEIDRDNFDAVLKKFNLGLELKFFETDENTIKINFAELYDFHPDKVFQRLPLFAHLRDVRRKLSNPNTYNDAATEIRSWIIYDNSKGLTDDFVSDISETADSPNQNALLDQILNQTSVDVTSVPDANAGLTELSLLVKKLVKPHLIQIDTEEQSNLLLMVDEITSDLMRKIIHHPQFQALESAWRGVYLLVRKIETSNNLRIFISNVDKSSLLKDLKVAENLAESDVYKLITHSENVWSVVGGNYTFDMSVNDAAALMRLAKICFSVNIPFISSVLPVMFGFRSFDAILSADKVKFAEDSKEGKLWNVLRGMSEATHLGLALPRFLARLPYGEKTDPTENFYFEEFTDIAHHEHFLWANSSFICVLLLAQSFNNSGWNINDNLIQNLDGLPIYYYQENTETKAKSCAEFTMTQSNAEVMIEQGLMPLISFRDSDRVRIGRFQSIAFSESMLKGRWH